METNVVNLARSKQRNNRTVLTKDQKKKNLYTAHTYTKHTTNTTHITNTKYFKKLVFNVNNVNNIDRYIKQNKNNTNTQLILNLYLILYYLQLKMT